MTKKNERGQFAKAAPLKENVRPVEDWLDELPEPYRSQALKARIKWPRGYVTCMSLSVAIEKSFRWAVSPQGDSYWFAVRQWALDPTKNALPEPWQPPATAPKEEQDHHDALITEYLLWVSEATKSVIELNDKLDRIQRDIDLLKSGSSFMQEIDKVKGQPEEQGLEEAQRLMAEASLQHLIRSAEPITPRLWPLDALPLLPWFTELVESDTLPTERHNQLASLLDTLKR